MQIIAGNVHFAPIEWQLSVISLYPPSDSNNAFWYFLSETSTVVELRPDHVEAKVLKYQQSFSNVYRMFGMSMKVVSGNGNDLG